MRIERLTKRASASTPNPSSLPSHPHILPPAALAFSRVAAAPTAAIRAVRGSSHSAGQICSPSVLVSGGRWVVRELTSVLEPPMCDPEAAGRKNRQIVPACTLACRRHWQKKYYRTRRWRCRHMKRKWPNRRNCRMKESCRCWSSRSPPVRGGRWSEFDLAGRSMVVCTGPERPWEGRWFGSRKPWWKDEVRVKP